MLIGVPKEIKDQEYRVGLTPAGAFALRHRGHDVVVERGAGARVGFPDAEYETVGARVAADVRAVWAAELMVKVKELQEAEFGFPHLGQVLTRRRATVKSTVVRHATLTTLLCKQLL